MHMHSKSSSSSSSLDDTMFLGFTTVLNISEPIKLVSYKHDVVHSHWRDAMSKEFSALQKQGTWDLVPLSSNQNIIGSKWIYKVKMGQNGAVSRYKARLVA